MLSTEVEYSINKLFRDARDKHHEFVTVEHLLLSMTTNPSAGKALRACGIDIPILQTELESYIEESTPLLTAEDKRETQPTLGFQRVIQRAVYHVQATGKGEVSGENILVAIFGEPESHAVYYLARQDMSRLDLVNYVSHDIRKDEAMLSDFSLDETNSSSEDSDINQDTDQESEEVQESPLEKFATNLNQQAIEGKIDPLIGRELEVERTVQVLCRRRKNNPLLVGESGVGKTAIAEGLAKRIVDKEVPEVLEEAIIYSLDLGAIVAGTKYRGDFEKRLKGVLTQIKKEEHAILFIDEIHIMIGAGATSGGTMDASNLLKPMLATGELKCIGSTTFQEYHSIFEKERALSRRFQKIDIKEPSVNETVKILKGLKSRFEEHHGVTYTIPALESAVKLSERYITDRFLPDKAIDVIDEAGANRQLQPKSTRKKKITVRDVEAIVAKIARIPPKTVSSTDMEVLRNLDLNLKRVVFGQDMAIDQLVTAVKMSRSGLRDDSKPIGSFVFAGPTGVGKTEVTNQLAENLGIELLRFDMSEYMERHTVSRLIGAPPGYVGFDDGGLLTDAVNKNPHAVLLLDEIEKAHPDVFNLLLQVMDNGFLTDSTGRKVDFRNVILVMTSNAGAENISRSSMGFTKQDHSLDTMKAIEGVFTPEFRNRLDGVIQFKPLDENVIISIVDKFLIKLEAQLHDKKVTLIVDDKAKRWLAKTGHDPVMGARPMERLIQEKIKRGLADEILFGTLSKDGGTVRITEKADDLKLTFESKAVPA
ncbi:ATP-dependent Clp protease ATP-binding subunit ClpA [Cocleimonas sp. KMM 6892]|uniref:ATP-dependent Clp protease ATP-binding subunit ClpA n=1 Tax=unclassified Cocleimonas TaxID=2639732 RepID=UPI002DBE694D|nr:MULTISPECIES: ATP-dependent Clp protease ATP-binding subunit ClpA [unclassified Cocleimonas]MEB8432222.1 ATP-dependent Clp protease ATP-binding subunit ClpA [Cocleimonas sp. KMM 6892]MEC4714692.1 ATP-dependent Clp protease ATP-binding subunit ClpA [Cocleimonas sp. KMM 6895]MEC4744494.1 ATP-dependent Clp protease ATP-binding subunit ClpA [Cocleimonas sp. KMM 6896]